MNESYVIMFTWGPGRRKRHAVERGTGSGGGEGVEGFGCGHIIRRRILVFIGGI